MRRIHDLMLWLGTADREILALCPEEEGRFVTAGGAVLTTTGMALLSGAFTFHALLHVPPVPAVLLGIVFALAIMNLERYVQASIRRQRTTVLTLLSAVPRISLAFLMGLVLSIPLLLAVFTAEIELQARADRDAELYAARQAINRQFPHVPDLQRRAEELEGQIHAIAVGTALKTSPAYVALGRRLNRLQTLRRMTSDEKLARSYARQANSTLAQIRPLRQELLDAEMNETIQARAAQRAELKTVRGELGPMLAERDRKITALGPKYQGDPGLADRIEALDELTESNGAVRSLKNVLWIFILAVDSLPALLKTLLSIGRKTVYEEVLEARELSTTQATTKSERLRCESVVQEATAFYTAQSDIAAERLAQHVKLQKEMDTIYMQAVTDALRPRAEKAACRAAERYADQMEDLLHGDADDAVARTREPRPRPPGGGVGERLRDWLGAGRREHDPVS